jgi:hypothetical protein
MIKKNILAIAALTTLVLTACGTAATSNVVEDTASKETSEETTDVETSSEHDSESVKAVENIETVKIISPSTESYLSDNAIKTDATPIEITEISKIPNEIIDTEEWFVKNGLSYPEMGENEDYSYEVYFNRDISTEWTTYTVMLTIYDKTTGNEKYSLDFSDFCYTHEELNYMLWREIQWVACRDNILYVSIWQNGYAESNSCYLLAINLDTMEVLWKSDSLVSNANNFILFDDVIMCAYGFTAEPDYIYQLDINTGETIDKYLLKTKADYLILKDNELYVRCYDTDYVFKVNEKSEEYTFEDLSKYSYQFCSGAGGWSTDFCIESDGYFYGNYHDSEMGATGDGYKNGTIYSCDFSGHFSGLTKVDDYAYEMVISDISYENEVGTEEIIDNIKYIYDEAYGLCGTKRFLVYFPGTPVNVFDEEVYWWISNSVDNSMGDDALLQTPVIVNEDEQFGIYSYENIE